MARKSFRGWEPIGGSVEALSKRGNEQSVAAIEDALANAQNSSFQIRYSDAICRRLDEMKIRSGELFPNSASSAARRSSNLARSAPAMVSSSRCGQRRLNVRAPTGQCRPARADGPVLAILGPDISFRFYRIVQPLFYLFGHALVGISDDSCNSSHPTIISLIASRASNLGTVAPRLRLTKRFVRHRSPRSCLRTGGPAGDR
jgi:hypothetical protein